MMGVPRGRLAVTMDTITDAMALVGQHGVYCQTQRWPRKPVLDVQMELKGLTDAKELIQSEMKALNTHPRASSRSYQVATTMVGIERKNENSRADARDLPAICPPGMVDIDRDVPGKTAERIWQAPIQTAWPRLMASIFQV